MYHGEIKVERRHGGRVVKVAGNGNGAHTIDTQVGLGAYHPLCRGGDVDISQEIAHTLLAVIKAVERHRACSVKRPVRPAHAHVGRKASLYRRSKRVKRKPVGKLYIRKLEHNIFLRAFIMHMSLFTVVFIVYGIQFKRARLVTHMQVGIQMPVRKVVRHKVIVIERPLLVPYHRVSRLQHHPDGRIGICHLRTYTEAFLAGNIALRQHEREFVRCQKPVDTHMGEIVECTGPVIHPPVEIQVAAKLP